jgi:NAD+ kinase
MKRAAIHSRSFEEHKLPFIQQVFFELEKRGIPVIVSHYFEEYLDQIHYYPQYEDIFDSPDDLKEGDVVFSIGGDGTLLEAITLIQEKETPILGINMGRLGFLATTAREKITEAIESVILGNYQIDSRSLLHFEADEDIFEGQNLALNELAILKRDSASMIIVHTYIDGEYLNSYWADGLIVSTPTGSTGYSLSVGGPIVLPQSNNFIIAPVSPHNLNVRPLIVPDTSVISFEIEGRSKNFLVSLDSRSRKVEANTQMAVRKCNYEAKLIQLSDNNFLKTLRSKLNWGMDIRNIQTRY